MRLFEPFRFSAFGSDNRIVLSGENEPAPVPSLAGLTITPRLNVEAGAAPVQGWRPAVEAVRRAGGRIVLQLSHPGRVSHPLLRAGAQLVAPSALAGRGTIDTPEGPQPLPVPRALEREDIAALVEQFAAAAALAQAEGFDGVEIHAAQGWLIDQFLRTGSNRREDDYGGSLSGRTRFLLEVAEAVSAVWGVGRVGVRVSPWSADHGMADGEPLETFTHVAAELDQLGVAWLHLVEPWRRKASVLGQLRSHFGGAVIAAGDHTPQSAEEVIAEGLADCIAFDAAGLAALVPDAGLRPDAPISPVCSVRGF
ncbi:oxidoreductase [Novosphingobium terrae]|uniref:oxidoreductase n=1 Tax=Novosphingobium terrae TaxID=2726189 RepID=UPI001980772E|nr:alkene reductase [Novosphingobium terrae]